ncbi:NfeD family protein [Dorea acetigenes]|jgi:membrane protein implicated in regulation of membrane protease activity|uniref:NfeD family protein n=1 Tax=Dorea acetigenes TaxID=2981787 RepID=A0ABT2RM26_9FIRM|nr:NfeD family protein [Dorea acetigenes]MCB6414315.1 NfeD family protein [Faecalimonas umbilicata]MCU6686224.1 NfeD family protein [Dorea acetigenes]SCI84780.1 NfeD-like C-terminal%2C partner-binding [uncultured Clostridium sp.]
METMYWLLIFIVLLVIEIGTMGLTTIWFAGGALAAFIMGIIGFGTGVQIAVFSIVSIVLLVSTRPIALKYFNKERQKTNAESLIGKQALVLEEVDTLHNKGVVEVNGQEWSAKTEEPSGVIAKNTVVTIEGIQGVKLIIKEKEEG